MSLPYPIYLAPQCCVPIGITSLSLVGFVELACAVINPSPQLHSFAAPRPNVCLGHRPYRPYMRLFFALSAAIGVAVMGADCTSAHAKSPSPTKPTYCTFGLTTHWYRSRHAKEVDRSLALHTSAQGLAGASLSRCKSTKSSTISISTGSPSVPTSRQHCCHVATTVLWRKV